MIYHDEVYAVMATVAENYQMKELTRTAKAIPFLLLALGGYVCLLVSLYFGWGWQATRVTIVLTGVSGGAIFAFLGVTSAIGSVIEAKKKDVNKEKFRIAYAALNGVCHGLDYEKSNHITNEELNVKLTERIERAKKALVVAMDEANAVDE